MKKLKFADGGLATGLSFAPNKGSAVPSSLQPFGGGGGGGSGFGGGSAAAGLGQIRSGTGTVDKAINTASQVLTGGGGALGGGDSLAAKPMEPNPTMPTFKKGGKVKKLAKGGSVSSASKRADGCAAKGKTKGKML